MKDSQIRVIERKWKYGGKKTYDQAYSGQQT